MSSPVCGPVPQGSEAYRLVERGAHLDGELGPEGCHNDRYPSRDSLYESKRLGQEDLLLECYHDVKAVSICTSLRSSAVLLDVNVRQSEIPGRPCSCYSMLRAVSTDRPTDHTARTCRVHGCHIQRPDGLPKNQQRHMPERDHFHTL